MLYCASRCKGRARRNRGRNVGSRPRHGSVAVARSVRIVCKGEASKGWRAPRVCLCVEKVRWAPRHKVLISHVEMQSSAIEKRDRDTHIRKGTRDARHMASQGPISEHTSGPSGGTNKTRAWMAMQRDMAQRGKGLIHLLQSKGEQWGRNVVWRFPLWVY